MFNLEKLLNRNRKGESKNARVYASEHDDNNHESFEGFICPTCHKDFPSAEELKKHFDFTHGVAASHLLSCPICWKTYEKEAELLSHNIQDHPTEELKHIKLKIEHLTMENEKLKKDLEDTLKGKVEIESSGNDPHEENKAQTICCLDNKTDRRCALNEQETHAKILILEREKEEIEVKLKVKEACLEAEVQSMQSICESNAKKVENLEKELVQRDKTITDLAKIAEDIEKEASQEKEKRMKLISEIEEGEGERCVIRQLREEKLILKNQLDTESVARLCESMILEAVLYTNENDTNEIKETLQAVYHRGRELLQANSDLKVEIIGCRSHLKSMEDVLVKKIEELEQLCGVAFEVLEVAKSKCESYQQVLLDSNKILRGAGLALLWLIQAGECIDLPPVETAGIEESAALLINSVHLVNDELSVRRKDLHNLNAEISEMSRAIEQKERVYSQELTNALRRAENAEEIANETKNNFLTLQSSRNDCYERIKIFEDNDHENQKKIKKYQSSVELLQEVNDNLAEELRISECHTEELSSALKELNEEKSALSAELKSCKNCLVQKSVQVDNLRDEKEKNLKDLKAAKQLLVENNVKFEKELEQINVLHSKESEVLKQKVLKLMHDKEDLEKTNLFLSSKMEVIQSDNQEKEKKWDETVSQYEAKISVLTENTNTLKQDLLYERKHREHVEKNLDEITSIKLELEAKLMNALEERSALLDRCLKSESENEKLLQSNADLHRKMNDTIAALHELGRENQALQIETLKHLGRKWADDSEVTHCTTCGKAFSVTVRKHHCRNCGCIFCNECSSKTATVPSSKKPARVCNQCFSELSK